MLPESSENSMKTGVTPLPCNLLAIGDAAARSLPVVFTALSCGAARPVSSLSVFALCSGSSVSSRPDFSEIEALASSFSAASRLLKDSGCPALFPAEIAFQSAFPVFRDLRSASADSNTTLLFDALRGKGLPFSFRSDPEVVQWSFADLLSRPEDPSMAPLFAWFSGLENARGYEGEKLRLAVLADPADPFSAGCLLALLPILRSFSFDVSLLALAETSSPLPESFFPTLSASLRFLEDLPLPVWLLSLPSSMASDPSAHGITFLALARVLSSLSEKTNPGLYTLETDGTLSLASLRDQASSFAAFLRAAAWMVSDLIPSLRQFLSHPARLRSLTVSPRTGLFRMLFPAARTDQAAALEDLATLDSALRVVLSRVLSFLRGVPFALRPSGENSSLWQQAVNACGRYITVASEYDTSAAEAAESGLDSVRPVHRVSMADTEEEQLVRRLQEMKAQLESESAALEGMLSSLGGYRALQVRLDCYFRCRDALVKAREDAAAPREGLDNLSLLRRERRVRQLEAAVARCREDLYSSSVQAALSLPPSGVSASDDPYAFSVLSPEACRALESLLAAPEGESGLKIPPLFSNLDETDPKVRARALASACGSGKASSAALRPVPFLFSRAFAVCLEELAPVRFVPSSLMPAVPLLPDLIVDEPLRSVRDVLSRLPVPPVSGRETAEQRGLLALLLLRPYRRRQSSEASLSSVCCRPADSPAMACWLSSHRSETAFILSLEKDETALPFALVLPGRLFLPARRIAAHRDLIPAFASWYDPETDTFNDPVPYLGESDRKLLTERLTALRKELNPEEQSLDRNPEERSDKQKTLNPEPYTLTPLQSLIEGFLQDLTPNANDEAFPADPALETRLRAVYGLSALSAYEPYLSKDTCFYERVLSSDPVAACLLGRESFPGSSCPDMKEDVLWLYRGVPFAREDSRLLLSSPRAAGEDFALSRLQAECSVLSESSDDFRDALLKNLGSLPERFPSALPARLKAVSSLLKESSQPLEGKEPVFLWPWDEKSPSVLTVLHESLGSALSEAGLHPFSECLSVFPARGHEVIGDSLFSAMCTVLPSQEAPEGVEIAPDAVLPPLSPSFGRALCLLPEGRTLLKAGLLSFDRFREESSGFAHDVSDCFRVTLTLDGAFPVHLVRVYTGEEVLHLYAHDIPTVALWPSVPFRPEDWRAYYLYAHLSPSWSASALTADGSWADLSQTSENRFAAALESYPAAFSLLAEGKTAGLLPNVLPPPLVEPSAPVRVCVDFGSSGTSVIFSSGAARRPMHGPVMVRTLLNNPSASRDLLRREFLPAVPVSALLPTVTRLFRNVPGASPVPFADGIVLMSADLEDLLSTPSDAIYTSLRWEEEKGRSGFLCLHQVLLMAALQARFEGATALSWRFSLPDEMAKDGRESLMNLFLSLSDAVLRESGYPPAVGDPPVPPVYFASDSSALGAYFRFCAAEYTRGGFMVLDLGACTADISLFLRGREQAVRTCQIPLGVHYMLLPALLRDPELLARDFGFCPDERFRRDLSLLSRALSSARTDPMALRRARVALDFFVADHLPLLVSLALQLASGGWAARSGALILLHLAFLLMLSGLVLLQIAADPSRNDFLPERMSLCLSGRGSAILESLPPPLRKALWHFLSMFRNRRVASLSLLFSSEKKMEIPVGLSLLNEVSAALPPASAVPASIAVRPADLLPEFLLRFRSAFPASAELLFPGFFTSNPAYPFSDRGRALLAASIDQSFPAGRADLSEGASPRPYDSLAAWLGNILDLAVGL